MKERDECGVGNQSTKTLAFYTARTGVFGAGGWRHYMTRRPKN